MLAIASPLEGVALLSIRFDLDAEPDAAALDCLTNDERRRVQTLRQRADRVRFGITRAALRNWLGATLGMPPAAVRLVRGRYGKPMLHDAMPFGFNVSHSGNHGLIAIGRNVEVGVDIEQCRPLDALPLAEAAFSREECDFLRRLPEDAGLHHFYGLWTAREALTKALGTGIADECVRSLTLRRMQDETWRIGSGVARLPFDAEALRLASLDVVDGYTAAVAMIPHQSNYRRSRIT
jgi:4'-phosphopantetheinyl transferase